MLVDVLDDSGGAISGRQMEMNARPFSPFMHQQDMRPTRNIRMNRHWENKFVIFAVIIIEMILSSIKT